MATGRAIVRGLMRALTLRARFAGLPPIPRVPRHPVRWIVWGGVGIAVIGVLLAPHAFLLRPLAYAATVGLAVYLVRLRAADGVLHAGAMQAASALEPAAPALLACLVLPAVVLTRRPAFSLAWGGGLVVLLQVALELKRRFAGTELTLMDVEFFLRQLRSNVDVLSGQPTVVAVAIGCSAAWCAAMGAAWRFDGRPSRGVVRPVHALHLLMALMLLSVSAHEVFREASALRQRGAWSLIESPAASVRPMMRFIATGGLAPEWSRPPRDTRPFAAAVAARVAAQPAAAPRPADIVVFLQESQFSPGAWRGCPAALCAQGGDLFDAGAQTDAFGPLRVHVFGGGTWLSEFSLAAGVPHTVFGEAGTFAPFNVAPVMRRGFVHSLRAAGYRTVALYPVRGSMMNAQAAYRHYGYDRFLDARALGLKDGFSTPDEAMHRAARDVLDEERRHGRPVFMLVVTVFNHGDHGVRMHRVPQPLRDEAARAFPDASEGENVADYLWRTGEAARVMRATRERIVAGRTPAVVAWFGDHQPAFGGAVALRGRIESRIPGEAARWQTWYRIDSNVPARPRASAPRAVDVSLLPGELAQAAGIRLDEWLAANVIARERCKGLLTACADPQGADDYFGYLHRGLHAFGLP